MKLHALTVLILAACTALPVSSQACTFDQQGVASELRRIADRNPGYVTAPGGLSVEWTVRGYKVRLSYGGCEDLGAEVLVARAASSRPVGTRELIATVSRYWSPAQGRALKSALASGRLVRRSEGATTYLDASGSVSPAFPLGFTIELRKDQVSLSWPAE